MQACHTERLGDGTFITKIWQSDDDSVNRFAMFGK